MVSKFMNYETSLEIEVRLADHFNYRQNIIVPNISWGMNMHECDLLIITKAGYATEIEIKISKSDLIKDKKKEHGHQSILIKYLYFAIPEKLDKEEIKAEIPARAGIIIINKQGKLRIDRKPLKNNGCVKLTDSQILNIARLGAMRIWNLKHEAVIKNSCV